MVNARAAFIAILAHYVKVFGLAGDVEAARIATDAISRLLGSQVRRARVVDIQQAKASLRDQ